MPTTTAVSPSGTTTQTPTPQPKQDRGVGSLSSTDFFKIMITELQQQDPLQPSKTSDMISQVSQIRSIELSGKLTDTLNQLASQQRTAGTSELLGKYVSAQTNNADGQSVVTEGICTGVRYASDGTAVLDLDNGGQVPATAVTMVTTVEQHDHMAAAAATGAGGPTTAANAKAGGIAALNPSAPAGSATAGKTGASRTRSGQHHKWFSFDGLFHR